MLLLEKAYAKLHGSYFALRGGFANEGMLDLTGSPTEAYEFEEHPDVSKLFTKILDYDHKGYLMSASTAGEDKFTEDKDSKVNEENEGGLIPGHAYSIIKAVQYEGHQLLNIRNPWGTFEWQGKWADNDRERWSDKMVEGVKPVFGDDGTFWMCFEDFVEHFKTLNVCKVGDWEEVRVKGEFLNARTRYFYELSVPTPTQTLTIGVHQEDDRIEGVGSRKPFLNTQLVILKRNP